MSGKKRVYPVEQPDDNAREYVVLGSIVGFLFAIIILAAFFH